MVRLDRHPGAARAPSLSLSLPAPPSPPLWRPSGERCLAGQKGGGGRAAGLLVPRGGRLGQAAAHAAARTVKEMEPIGVRRPKASDMKSACISVPFDPPSVFGGGGGGGGKHGSGSHTTSHRQVFEPSAWKTQPMNHASATSLSERNISTVNTPESATVAIAKSCERMAPPSSAITASACPEAPCAGSRDGSPTISMRVKRNVAVRH